MQSQLLTDCAKMLEQVACEHNNKALIWKLADTQDPRVIAYTSSCTQGALLVASDRVEGCTMGTLVNAAKMQIVKLPDELARLLFEDANRVNN